MARAPKTEIVELHSDVTYDDLAEIERTKGRANSRPKELPLNQINVADGVFQWRLQDEDIAASQQHTHELARVLRDQKKPLEPILLTAIGDKAYVVDGHHRLQAYHAAKWKRKVPVEWFEGDLLDATLEAFKRNSRNKLPMTHAAKLEAAWTCVKAGNKKEGGMSKAEISDMTTIPLSTIGNMRNMLAKHGEAVAGMTWKEAKRHDRLGEFDVEDWKENRAKNWAKQMTANITKNLGPDYRKHLDIFARALEMVDEEIPRRLIRTWSYIAKDILEEIEEEWGGLDI